jgi:hypothetical protein
MTSVHGICFKECMADLWIYFLPVYIYCTLVHGDVQAKGNTHLSNMVSQKVGYTNSEKCSIM